MSDPEFNRRSFFGTAMAAGLSAEAVCPAQTPKTDPSKNSAAPPLFVTPNEFEGTDAERKDGVE